MCKAGSLLTICARTARIQKPTYPPLALQLFLEVMGIDKFLPAGRERQMPLSCLKKTARRPFALNESPRLAYRRGLRGVTASSRQIGVFSFSVRYGRKRRILIITRNSCKPVDGPLLATTFKHSPKSTYPQASYSMGTIRNGEYSQQQEPLLISELPLS